MHALFLKYLRSAIDSDKKGRKEMGFTLLSEHLYTKTVCYLLPKYLKLKCKFNQIKFQGECKYHIVLSRLYLYIVSYRESFKRSQFLLLMVDRKLAHHCLFVNLDLCTMAKSGRKVEGTSAFLKATI